MIRKTTLLTILFGSLICFPADAQQDSTKLPPLAINTSDYNTAIGLRGGVTSGITIKHFISDDNALKGLFGVWHHGFSGTLLFEHYVPAYDVAGLQWYYGAGGHASFESRHAIRFQGDNAYTYREDGFGLGVDGIVGIEYKLPEIPFAFSVDLKPFMEVNNYGEVWLSLDPGLGAKLTF